MLDDVSGRWRQSNAARLPPDGPINFILVADLQCARCLSNNKIASLIFRPERRFLAVTLFQRRTRPNLSLGSSSLISLRRQAFSDSRPRLRPPGNIQTRSLFRRTSRTFPRLTATSFDDVAI